MTEQTDFYIGVDGGGTKTKVLVTDNDFNIIGEGYAGSSNVGHSVEGAWASILTALSSALTGTKISIDNPNSNFHAGMGLAGVSINDAREKFINTPHHFKTLVLETDAHISCLAAHDGKDGSIINTGTGVIGYSIEADKSFRIGGWGFPHADTGGGAWLGMEIIRLTCCWLDGCIEGTPLLKNIYSLFECSSSKLITWANNAASTDFATLAPFVLEALTYKDKYALNLIIRSAEEIDLIVKALKDNIENKNNKCLLTGGISRFIYPYLRDKDFLTLSDESKTADKGAIYMLKRFLNNNSKEES